MLPEILAGFVNEQLPFQWTPTLGGECYRRRNLHRRRKTRRFNGHPPLGVNATVQSTSSHPPFVKGATRFLTFPHDFELNALREPLRDLNSRAILEEVRAKSVFRWRGWCGVFLGAFLSSKLGGVLGVVWGVFWV